MFYVEKLLLSENHVPFTLMLLAGVPFCWKLLAFRYVVTVLGALFICHTNLLAALSPRYCYYFQPLLLLGGIAATIALYDHLISLAARAGNAIIPRTVAHITGITVLALLFIQSNDWLLKDYSLAINGDSPGLMTRMNTYRYDYRGAAEYVKNQFEEGDVIIPAIPHVFENYSGLSADYFLDTLLAKKSYLH